MPNDSTPRINHKYLHTHSHSNTRNLPLYTGTRRSADETTALHPVNRPQTVCRLCIQKTSCSAYQWFHVDTEATNNITPLAKHMCTYTISEFIKRHGTPPVLELLSARGLNLVNDPRNHSKKCWSTCIRSLKGVYYTWEFVYYNKTGTEVRWSLVNDNTTPTKKKRVSVCECVCSFVRIALGYYTVEIPQYSSPIPQEPSPPLIHRKHGYSVPT
jgi:hypothetical protein